MGATADPTTTTACPGSITCCGTCQPTFFNVLPGLFQSTGQAISQITQSNNQVKVAQINAQVATTQAQLKASTAPTMYLVIGLGVVALIVVVFVKPR